MVLLVEHPERLPPLRSRSFVQFPSASPIQIRLCTTRTGVDVVLILMSVSYNWASVGSARSSYPSNKLLVQLSAELLRPDTMDYSQNSLADDDYQTLNVAPPTPPDEPLPPIPQPQPPKVSSLARRIHGWSWQAVGLFCCA